VIVIPAIDIKGGRCVRLRQGEMTRETVFSEAPEKMAERWHREGAERLHLVDLDGAVRGEPVNREAIRRVVSAVPIPIQLGGGIRDLATIEDYFRIGVGHVILGTVAHKEKGFVREACDRYPGRIILGIDARNNRVSIEGWTEDIDLSPVDLAKQYEESSISAIVYTDILKDGMSKGPNVESVRTFAESVKPPVIASGGISGISDIKAIGTLAGEGVMGMIVGRALYEGTVDLWRALEAVR